MTTVAVANQKGGCGKTTTAINLSACLANQGLQILLVDLDPQSHATIGLGDASAVNATGAAEVLSGTCTMREALRPASDGLDLLPSSWRLADYEASVGGGSGQSTVLRNSLRDVRGDYSLVVLDCPPSTGPLTRSALAAADLVLVPVETSYFALYGVGRMLTLIEEEERRREGSLPYRILLTLYDRRTTLARDVLKQLREHFDSLLLNSLIAVNVSLREAASHGKPITHYRRKSRGFRDHMELSGEILATLSKHGGAPHQALQP